jgi:MFS family permease
MSARITTEKGFYGWVNVAVTSTMGMVSPLYLISFGYFLPFLVKDLGWERWAASLASTIFNIVMGICGPLAGYFIVKHGAKRAILIGNILGCAGFVMLFFHSRLWKLYLGYGVLIGLGAFVGSVGAPIAGYIRDTTGSHLPAFRPALAVFAAGLICLLFARPPVHPTLKKPEPADAVPQLS